jgi:hypothetical protein
MMLTCRSELDIADEDHLIVFLGEGLPEQFARLGVQTGKKLGVHARDAGRRLLQPLAVRIFADGQQKLADGCLDARGVNPVRRYAVTSG